MSAGLALRTVTEGRRPAFVSKAATRAVDPRRTANGHVNSVGDDRVISQYKFFLAFENAVHPGYAS